MPPRKSKVEWFVIIALSLLFGAVWLFAHWNLARKPPYHKGPGSAGYVDPVSQPPPDQRSGK